MVLPSTREDPTDLERERGKERENQLSDFSIYSATFPARKYIPSEPLYVAKIQQMMMINLWD